MSHPSDLTLSSHPEMIILSLRSIALNGIQIDVIEGEIGALVDEVMPERRLGLFDTLNESILGVIDGPHTGPVSPAAYQALKRQNKLQI
jgi:hypothetical protein